MDQEAFVISPAMAETFFRCCKLYRINEMPDRMALIRKIVARKKAVYLRDVKPFLTGKKAVQINIKREPPSA